MRVLHFAHSFAPQYGGTTTRLMDLLPLTQDEHFLYVPRPSSTVAAEEDFGSLHVRRRELPALRPSRAGAWLSKQVIDDGIDIIHGHNPPTFAWASLHASRRMGVPLVYEAHRLSFDSFMDRTPGPSWRSAKGTAHALVREGVFFYAAAAIIVQTPNHQRRILSLYPGLRHKVHVVPVHVDTERFDRSRLAESQQTLKRQLRFPDAMTFLYCGHLTLTNGVHDLLAAVMQLPVECRERMRLVVLGQGPLEQEVRDAALRMPDTIDFRSLVAFDDMPRYYAAADVVVAPSRANRVWACNNPTKLLEAMSMQRPVLGSDVGGIAQVVEDDRNGFLFRAGSIEHLTRRMQTLIDMRDALQPIADRARETVVAHHRAPHCAARLAAVYATARQSRPRRASVARMID
jgi:glycosyltransferase involved in cell wall biosynthesis